MPGLITPARRGGRWLVDGGLVNPVPISLCRAMGADSVIAVDLNTTLLGRRGFDRAVDAGAPGGDSDDVPGPASLEQLGADEDAGGEAGRLRAAVEAWARELRERVAGTDGSRDPTQPSLYEVLANSLNIMQVRITRSRMAGDPADLLVTPRLADFALLDLDRGDEAIREGRRATERALALASYGDPGASNRR